MGAKGLRLDKDRVNSDHGVHSLPHRQRTVTHRGVL